MKFPQCEVETHPFKRPAVYIAGYNMAKTCEQFSKFFEMKA